jgi:hypothetical protein
MAGRLQELEVHHCNVVYHQMAETLKAIANHRSDVAEYQMSEVLVKVDFHCCRLSESNWLRNSSVREDHWGIAGVFHPVDEALGIWIRTGTNMIHQKNSQNYRLAEGLQRLKLVQ